MTSYADLASRYDAALDAVGHGERAREAGRHLPFAVQEGLRESGFGRVGVPVADGGEGGGHVTSGQRTRTPPRCHPRLCASREGPHTGARPGFSRRPCSPRARP